MSFRNLWLRMVRLCSFVTHACNTFFLSRSLLLYIYTSLIMPHKKADKENSNPLSPHAIWSTTCDNILVDCLVVQRKNGKIPSNGSRGDSVWKTYAEALKDSHVHLGGAQKTGESCHNRWSAIRTSPFQSHVSNTNHFFFRSRRTTRPYINYRNCQASDGMTPLRLLQHLTVSGRICWRYVNYGTCLTVKSV